MFRCEAVYRGCRAVLGAQSSSTLTLLVEHLLAPNANGQLAHDGGTHTYTKLRSERCQLQCDDERLQVTPIRRDEGFESDSESSGSTCDESFCSNQDIKMINDHVLRLDHLIHHDSAATSAAPFTSSSSSSSSSDDISSSATSSGNESEDDTPRSTSECIGTSVQNSQSQVDASRGAPAVSGGNAGGGCANTTIGDTFLMSDILYCHVAPATPRVVVVVVKDAGSSQVYAHVFQCLTEEAARALYAHYKEASNKYKLNRYRNSKRKTDPNSAESPVGGGATVYKSGSISSSSHKDALYGKPPSGSVYSSSKVAGGSLSRLRDGGGVGGGSNSSGRGSLRSVEARLLKGEKRDLGNNVNVIEIREASQLDNRNNNNNNNEDPSSPWNLVQHTDSNGVTHIEIESGPCSLMSSSSDTSDFNSLASVSSQQQGGGQLTMNSLTALLPSHTTATTSNSDVIGSSLQGSSSCPTSLISTEREILIAGEVEKKTRQRQPPQFLREQQRNFGHPDPPSPWRQEDNIWGEETLRRSDNFNKRDEYHRRGDKKNREEREGRSRRGRHEVELRSHNTLKDTVPLSMPLGSVEGLIPRLPQERPSRAREQSRTRLRHSHNKGPAPPPPPRRHPNNPSLLLVPTKSGAENARAFYPKESHIIRGNKVVRVQEYPGYSSTWMHHDINNNPHHYSYYAHGNAWIGAAHEYHAMRPRETTSTITNEMRRRSRSKSPARRPMAHRYIDAVSTFNLSQKLKDISEAVFTGKRNGNSIQANANLSAAAAANNSSHSSAHSGGAREGKGHSRSMSTVSASAVEGLGDGTLKSVIKKGRKVEGSPQTRRVTFSAYATVQVMEA
ncbi:serine-rich adhesin for platelets-like [Macrobrachium nipponense]|uniref:serine-rich adhesin for platelets-like n=1 Tax=Macrobrachium nipponense TaxID=159736 RepID=UPI0030C8178B